MLITVIHSEDEFMPVMKWCYYSSHPTNRWRASALTCNMIPESCKLLIFHASGHKKYMSHGSIMSHSDEIITPRAGTESVSRRRDPPALCLSSDCLRRTELPLCSPSSIIVLVRLNAGGFNQETFVQRRHLSSTGPLIYNPAQSSEQIPIFAFFSFSVFQTIARSWRFEGISFQRESCALRYEKIIPSFDKRWILTDAWYNILIKKHPLMMF